MLLQISTTAPKMLLTTTTTTLMMLLLVIIGSCGGARLKTTTASALETVNVNGVEGHPAILPCSVDPPAPGEVVYLVLWYRGDEGEPLYSYDSRQGAWNKGQRWSDSTQFGDRAFFHLSSNPAELRIQDIQLSDEGVYRCRVDFKSAPTHNSLVNLSVIIPPSVPRIVDAAGHDLKDMVGPYVVGDVSNIKCIVAGGNPAPSVTWWREGRLIDSSWERGFQGSTYGGNSDTHNTLQIGPLTRQDLGTVLTCQGSNNNISVPTSRRVTVDMVFPPSTATINMDRQPLSTGKTYKVECETSGSRPPAVITWWLGEKFLGKTDQREQGGSSFSELMLEPSPDQDKLPLTCRAENTLMRAGGGALEDVWNLSVYYAPIVRLKLGHKLESHILEEGSDIYLDCQVESNPKHYKIVWLHDDRVLEQDVEAGLIVSGLSLVLQRIGRERKGNYSCLVSNIEGDTRSNIITLMIKYVPRCVEPVKTSVGTILGRSLQVKCEVDAFPPATSFSWKFNNSKESINVRSQDFTDKEGSSILTYSAHSDRDFGHLYCWARNDKGAMLDPCVFHVIPAGPPQPPATCTILNQTTDLLQVECTAGFDGGLDQTFLLEVVDIKLNKVLVNVSSGAPLFTITGLNPGRDLELHIYGVNLNGRSEPTVLEGFRLKVAELQIDSESPVPLEFTPFLGILAGILLTLSLAAIVIILIIRRKYRVKAPTVAVPTQADADEYFPANQNSGVCYPSTKKGGRGDRSPSSYYPAPNRESIIPPRNQDTRPDIIQTKTAKDKPRPNHTIGRGGGGAQQSYTDSSCDTYKDYSDAAIYSQQSADRRRLIAHSPGHRSEPVQTISNRRTNITVNPGDNSASWTPLLHLHQESVL